MRDGERVVVPGGKVAELLVRLALAAGTVVPTETLLDDLWGGTATRRNTLQSKVARLRRALGDAAAVDGRDGGYVLAVEPDAVDALLVARDAAIASRCLAAGDDGGAAAASAAGLARYRGEVLPVAGDWSAVHRARLDDTRTQLVEARLAARVRLGEAATAELEAAVLEHPYQEGLWELL